MEGWNKGLALVDEARKQQILDEINIARWKRAKAEKLELKLYLESKLSEAKERSVTAYDVAAKKKAAEWAIANALFVKKLAQEKKILAATEAKHKKRDKWLAAKAKFYEENKKGG